MQSSTQTAESGQSPMDQTFPKEESVTTLLSEGLEHDAFLEWLSPKDRIVHDLAVKMLKTRYTPERSNAWIAWQKSLKKA
jgi:hypothetical protein